MRVVCVELYPDLKNHDRDFLYRDTSLVVFFFAITPLICLRYRSLTWVIHVLGLPPAKCVSSLGRNNIYALLILPIGLYQVADWVQCMSQTSLTDIHGLWSLPQNTVVYRCHFLLFRRKPRLTAVLQHGGCRISIWFSAGFEDRWSRSKLLSRFSKGKVV